MLRNANRPTSGGGTTTVPDLDFNQLTPAQVAAITAATENAGGNEVQDTFGNNLGTVLL